MEAGSGVKLCRQKQGFAYLVERDCDEFSEGCVRRLMLTGSCARGCLVENSSSFAGCFAEIHGLLGTAHCLATFIARQQTCTCNAWHSKAACSLAIVVLELYAQQSSMQICHCPLSACTTQQHANLPPSTNCVHNTAACNLAYIVMHLEQHMQSKPRRSKEYKIAGAYCNLKESMSTKYVCMQRQRHHGP